MDRLDQETCGTLRGLDPSEHLPPDKLHYASRAFALMSATAGMVVEPVESCRAAITPVVLPALWLRLVAISSMCISSAESASLTRKPARLLRS